LQIDAAKAELEVIGQPLSAQISPQAQGERPPALPLGHANSDV
jgi:hypothetical protein